MVTHRIRSAPLCASAATASDRLDGAAPRIASASIPGFDSARTIMSATSFAIARPESVSAYPSVTGIPNNLTPGYHSISRRRSISTKDMGAKDIGALIDDDDKERCVGTDI